MTRFEAYLFTVAGIALSITTQLVWKAALGRLPPMPEGFDAKLMLILRYLVQPYILLGFAIGFLAALAWITGLSKLPLSTVYPLVSLTFPIIAVFGYFLFEESLSVFNMVGIALIAGGVYLTQMS